MCGTYGICFIFVFLLWHKTTIDLGRLLQNRSHLCYATSLFNIFEDLAFDFSLLDIRSGVLAAQVVRQSVPLSSCETAKVTLPALDLDMEEGSESD